MKASYYRINTLEKFANLINESEYWESDFYGIIDRNKWEDHSQDTWLICSNETECIVMSEMGICYVIEKSKVESFKQAI